MNELDPYEAKGFISFVKACAYERAKTAVTSVIYTEAVGATSGQVELSDGEILFAYSLGGASPAHNNLSDPAATAALDVFLTLGSFL